MNERDRKIQDILSKIDEDNTTSNTDPIDTPFFLDDEDVPKSYKKLGYRKGSRNVNVRKLSTEIQEEWLESIQGISLKNNPKKTVSELFKDTIQKLNLLEKILDKKLNESAINKYSELYNELENSINRIGYHFIRRNK